MKYAKSTIFFLLKCALFMKMQISEDANLFPSYLGYVSHKFMFAKKMDR